LPSGLTFFLCVRVSRWGKDVSQTCGSSFLSHFVGNRLALGTERTKLVCGDDQSVISFRICWPRSSKTSKSSVRSTRSRRKYTFLNLGESTINGLNDTCCEQLGVSFHATTHGLCTRPIQIKETVVLSCTNQHE